MKTALGLEDYLAENGWQILNDDFIGLVRSSLPKGLAAHQIGRAASRLGARSVKIGRQRGREFPKVLLEKFRLGLYL